MVKKACFFTAGFLLVVAGIALTLKNWIFLQMLFSGIIGPILAIGGLVLLTMTRD